MRGDDVPTIDLLGLEVSAPPEPRPQAPASGKDVHAFVIATPPAENNQPINGYDLGQIMEEVLRLAKSVSEMQKDNDRGVHPPPGLGTSIMMEITIMDRPTRERIRLSMIIIP